MISLADYAAYDGLGLARLVAKKQVSAAELADAAHRAIEAVNPKLNAVLQDLSTAAKRNAGKLDMKAPFVGVPLVIKELSLQAKGVRQDMGSRLGQGTVPKADTELMARYRKAGFSLVGTTQTPELGYCPTTETVLHGPVHNPWNLHHSAGGSSGGSGAAVAAGIVPVGHANDGGGSIRIPASCNGLIGLKPSRDRIPTGPTVSDPLSGLAIEFAVTRSVRDTAALLDALGGADVGAPGIPPAPPKSYSALIKAKPKKLKIAWSAKPANGATVHPDNRLALRDTLKALEGLGHTIIERTPKYSWDEFLDAMNVIWTASNAFVAGMLGHVTGRPVDRTTLEAVTLACVDAGRRYSALDMLSAQAFCNRLSRAFGEFFEDIDVFMTPTLGRPPALLGEINQNANITAEEWTRSIFDYCPFTPQFNTTGQPAISLPLHWNAQGLPIGVQFAAKLGDEATLLILAAQLEEARPWARRKPPHHAST